MRVRAWSSAPVGHAGTQGMSSHISQGTPRASKYGVPTISAGEAQDASFFERYANYFYEPTDMNLRRILSNNVDALAGAGFFGTSPKIGVIPKPPRAD